MSPKRGSQISASAAVLDNVAVTADLVAAIIAAEATSDTVVPVAASADATTAECRCAVCNKKGKLEDELFLLKR